MAFFSNFASDLIGSLRSPRLYKSLRDTPNYKEKGYNFAYNLGTFSAVTGANVGGLRSGLYNSLQASNTMKALSGKSQSRMRSGTRRLVFRGAAFVTSNVMRSMLPQGAGLAGRFVRASAGRFSARRLQRFDMKVQEMLYGNFRVDANKIDAYAKSPNTSVGFDLKKIQQAMQAIAISNAPDPYKAANYNRKYRDTDITPELGRDEKVMSSFSLQTFDDDNIEALMSRRDIADIMGENALAGSPNALGNYSPDGAMSAGEKGSIMESLYGPPGSSGKSFDREGGSTIGRGEADTLARLASEEFQFGEGAQYAFGTGAVGDTQETIDVISDIIMLSDRYSKQSSSGVGLGDKNQMAMAVARRIEELRVTLGNDFLKEIGKMRDVTRFLHGDEREMQMKSKRGKSYTKNQKLEIYKLRQESFNVTTNEEVTVANQRMVTGPSTGYIITGEDYDGRGNFRGFKGRAVPGPILDTPIKSGDPVKEIRKKTERRTRNMVEGESLGTLDYRKGYRGRTREGETPIHRDGTLQTTFSDQPNRHNFVPNRRQIQSSIHALDPVTNDKKATVVYAVAFGGKSKRSSTNDSIRDAFQIEYGGPATDRHGKLANRTDHFVFTPSLFMYRSAIGAAKAFGLGVSSGRNIVGHLTGASGAGMSQKLTGSTLNDVYVKSRGVAGPNKQQQKILEEIYQKSAKNGANPIFEAGQLMLSKNKVMASSFDKGSLDIVSDIMNDTIFGGANKNLQNRVGMVFDKDTGRRNYNALHEGKGADRRPFEKVIDDNDILSAEKMIHKLQKETGKTRFEITDNYFDKYTIGDAYDFPPPGGFQYRTYTDEDGMTKYKITGITMDESDFLQDSDGNVFIPGQVINGRTKRNITSLDSGYDYDTTGVADDVSILSDPEPGSEEFRKAPLNALSKQARILRLEMVEQDVQAAFRQQLRILSELDNDQIVDLSSRLTNQLMRQINGGMDVQGPIELGAREHALIQEFFGVRLQALDEHLRKYSPRTTGLNKSTPHLHTETGKGDRESAILDAALSGRQMGTIFDVEHMDELVRIFESGPEIEDVLRGKKDVKAAARIAKKRSEQELLKLQSNINNAIDDQIPNVSGKKRNRVEIPGTSLDTHGSRRSGEGYVDKTVVKGNNTISKIASEEVTRYRLAGGGAQAQMAYVEKEIRRLDKSTARAKVKEQIIQKCAQNLHIKNAWSRYILSNESARDGLGLDHTVGSIGRYLDHYFDNIGMTPPDF